MPGFPTDRAYIEAVEALTWIAFGKCEKAATILSNSLGDAGLKRWRIEPKGPLLRYLEHVVEGEHWKATDGAATDWPGFLGILRVQHETDDAGLLKALRADMEREAEQKRLLDEAEAELLEAARAEKLSLLGFRVKLDERPDGSAKREIVPIADLLNHVAFDVYRNRLTYDWKKVLEVGFHWSTDYADVLVKGHDVLRLWPRHGEGKTGEPTTRRAPGRPRVSTAIDWIAVAAARESGATWKALARKYGVSDRTLRRGCRPAERR
jgi:hypothetical protein